MGARTGGGRHLPEILHHGREPIAAGRVRGSHAVRKRRRRAWTGRCQGLLVDQAWRFYVPDRALELRATGDLEKVSGLTADSFTRCVVNAVVNSVKLSASLSFSCWRRRLLLLSQPSSWFLVLQPAEAVAQPSPACCRAYRHPCRASLRKWLLSEARSRSSSSLRWHAPTGGTLRRLPCLRHQFARLWRSGLQCPSAAGSCRNRPD